MCFCPRRFWTAWRHSTTKRRRFSSPRNSGRNHKRHLFVFRQNKLHGHCSVIAAAFFPFILKVLAGFPKIYLLWMYSSGKSSVNERVISSGADYIASGVKLTELGSVGILISNDRLVRSVSVLGTSVYQYAATLKAGSRSPRSSRGSSRDSSFPGLF